jgi:hypothetical protein
MSCAFDGRRVKHKDCVYLRWALSYEWSQSAPRRRFRGVVVRMMYDSVKDYYRLVRIMPSYSMPSSVSKLLGNAERLVCPIDANMVSEWYGRSTTPRRKRARDGE